MKFSNFMNSLLTDLKKNSNLPKISSVKFMFKKPYLSQYLMVPTNEDSTFKFDCVESTNSYIVLSISSYT